jgi:hypothetical protein
VALPAEALPKKIVSPRLPDGPHVLKSGIAARGRTVGEKYRSPRSLSVRYKILRDPRIICDAHAANDECESGNGVGIRGGLR